MDHGGCESSGVAVLLWLLCGPLVDAENEQEKCEGEYNCESDSAIWLRCACTVWSASFGCLC